jgi:hypothetical protein
MEEGGVAQLLDRPRTRNRSKQEKTPPSEQLSGGFKQLSIFVTLMCSSANIIGNVPPPDARLTRTARPLLENRPRGLDVRKGIKPRAVRQVLNQSDSWN